MTRVLLAGAILFAMTGCDERVGRGIKAPTPMPLSMKATENIVEKKMPTPVQSEEVSVMNDVPILEDDLPTLPTPTKLSEPMRTEKGIIESKQVSTVTKSTGGLDIAHIRFSNSPERTRLVFDSYNDGAKSSVSGKYAYTYNASKKSITLTLKEYSNISALGNNKTRTYAYDSLVDKIYLSNTESDNGQKCIITLRKDAKVKVFDIKEPGRIVIDIFPR